MNQPTNFVNARFLQSAFLHQEYSRLFRRQGPAAEGKTRFCGSPGSMYLEIGHEHLAFLVHPGSGKELELHVAQRVGPHLTEIDLSLSAVS